MSRVPITEKFCIIVPNNVNLGDSQPHRSLLAIPWGIAWENLAERFWSEGIVYIFLKLSPRLCPGTT